MENETLFEEAAMTIESAYYQGQAKPQLVCRWERLACEADDPELATTQLVYELLLQVRRVKLILAWMLILPAAFFGLSLLISMIAIMVTSLY